MKRAVKGELYLEYRTVKEAVKGELYLEYRTVELGGEERALPGMMHC